MDACTVLAFWCRETTLSLALDDASLSALSVDRKYCIVLVVTSFLDEASEASSYELAKRVSLLNTCSCAPEARFYYHPESMYGFACCPRTTSSACQKFPYLCTYMRAHIYAHSLKRISFAQMTSLWVGQLSFEYAIKDLKTAMGTALVCTSLKWAVKTTMGGLKLLVQRAIARRQALDLFHSPILGSGTFKALQ